MRLVYITLARKILCYGSFPAKVLLGTNAYNSLLKYKAHIFGSFQTRMNKGFAPNVKCGHVKPENPS